MPEGLIVAFLLIIAGLLMALLRWSMPARWLISAGAAAGVVTAATTLPHGSAALILPFTLAGQTVTLSYATEALWLMGFGLMPAVLAIGLCSPIVLARPGWLVGAAMSLLGALGIYGVQDAYSFLISWELMSLGGAIMLLAERLSKDYGKAVLFMLALLEFGTVAILVAFLLLGHASGNSMDFAGFPAGAHALSSDGRILVGALLVVGFGAKLGLLPFYEWFPGAYACGSGASGAILSGVVLNAAFFALSRGLVQWLPSEGEWLFALGTGITVIGVFSAILAAFHAFQQDDWRRLLSFSTAENASIAVTVLGACLIFRENAQFDLAALAWTVALLHLAGHALAKGGLFLCADGIYRAAAGYGIVQGGWLRKAGVAFGVGALFCTMSLAAVPPQMGFVSEWFVFQTLFQGFHLGNLGGKLLLALAGAGLALTAAVALATSIKLFGVGLLGAPRQIDQAGISRRYCWCVLLLGVAVLASATGLPIWLGALDDVEFTRFGAHGALAMMNGWVLVPLTDTFAFISPSMLMIAMPLLAILPLLLLLNIRRHRIRRARVWYGGMIEDPQCAATTSLSFSNAMRTVYRLIYRPTQDTTREHRTNAYFVQKVDFHHDVAKMFDPWLFKPIQQVVWKLAGRLRALQSGDLNFYLALIGALLIVILFLTLLQ
ncbi:proton-conducting transporter transmembrane domain-containing protein [Pollutimonas bauzanensis]|uniref:Formate hydrogenlyase subunit 3/Multisubunit Na+/H+ antiporter, MnhD subunit n=1 Tax=Pollutimonas bauzanensis TaxID=658167 RepID=A0A1M6AUB7_9BURK|nr:proton-conducting transporter membrane subunit [Pollutimonas bauzanensis]SHI06205.1 Formate hydrogenlyase subunit 3/Multisubunit Na+/H+ antiporter, MnhD subunit [Pollutimonas bauzanensis]SHI39813.1 Formate hydrogenlyase subunit 3/Multisubunit Na+/H+ antiporter, MnhD subunit [Pollutimonas bauzanensis]